MTFFKSIYFWANKHKINENWYILRHELLATIFRRVTHGLALFICKSSPSSVCAFYRKHLIVGRCKQAWSLIIIGGAM